MPETIAVTDEASTSSQLNPASRVICRVCQKQFSQYTCPRCNIRYCSLKCYKSHSLRCTESFMRENVMEELLQLQPDDGTKQKMMDILKRFHSEEEIDDVDDDDASLSDEIVQKIMSGGEVSFDVLSSEQKKRFHRAVASGELSKQIEPWDPWWSKPSARTISLTEQGSLLINPMQNQMPILSPQSVIENDERSTFSLLQNDMDNDKNLGIPPGPETPLPPVSQISSVEPSPLLAVHLVDIMYSYCFTLHLYNGDWGSDAIGSSMVVLSISSVLGQCSQPETVFSSLAYCLEQACSPPFRQAGGLKFGLGLLDDVVGLLSLGSAALICGLCDLQRMMRTAWGEVKSEKGRGLNRMESRRKLKSAERKGFFMMCWVREQPGETWPAMAAIVEKEKNAVMSGYVDGGRESLRFEDEVKSGNKVALIQEIE